MWHLPPLTSTSFFFFFFFLHRRTCKISKTNKKNSTVVSSSSLLTLRPRPCPPPFYVLLLRLSFYCKCGFLLLFHHLHLLDRVVRFSRVNSIVLLFCWNRVKRSISQLSPRAAAANQIGKWGKHFVIRRRRPLPSSPRRRASRYHYAID